jgi:hypothetical protein
MDSLPILRRARHAILALALAAAFTSPAARAQEAADAPTNDDLSRSLERLRGERGLGLEVGEIGRSAGGRPISMVRVTGRETEVSHPALLVVAGAWGPHTLGTGIALAVLDSLIAGYGRDSAVTALLDRVEVLVVPRLGPDAVDAGLRRPRGESVRNDAPRDDDRDGATDEDGPDDLDGNGLLTMMRIADPSGGWVEDPDDPGLMRPADPARGDRRAWKLLSEGRDDDGDGAWNEDPPGGADPSASFPRGYRWFEATSGDYPLSAPEARALAELVATRDPIAAVIVYGPQDNLAAPWAAEPGGGHAESGDDERDRRIREPLAAPLEGDVEWLAEVSRRYRDRTGRAESDTLGTRAFGGDPVSWAYYHMGRWAFGSSAWSPPDPGTTAPDSSAGGTGPDEGDDATAAGTRGAGREGPKDPVAAEGEGPKDPVAAERRLLRWLRAHRPDGFVEWSRVDHPDFPDRIVEVGGFAPGARWTPPAPEREEIERREVGFVIDLAGSLPRLALTRLEAESLGDGAWRVTARVANEGFLPTRTELASRLGLPRAVRVTIEGDGVEVVGGRSTQAIDDLPGGGAEAELSWVIVGTRGRRVTVRAAAPAAGEASAEVTLR